MNDKLSMKKGADPSETLAWNMKLISHHELAGFGGVGEGINMQLTKDGRRILWLAHESAPKNFTGVDVTDVKNPKVVVQTDLPHAKVRSNSLDVVGDLMAVAYQTKDWGLKPAGIDLFDVSKPEATEAYFTLRCVRTAFARRALRLVRRRRIRAPLVGRARFRADDPKDDQFYRIIDVRNPSKPPRKPAAGGAGHAQRRQRAAAPAPAEIRRRLPHAQHQRLSARPDRAYLGYIDGGAIILDISNKAHPKMISSCQYSPPFNGFTHTLMPLFERGLADHHRRVREGQRRGLAQAHLGRGCAGRTQSRADRTLPLPRPERSGASAAAASARTTCMRTIRARASFRSDES